jgi:pimeloyl-ACP methyl ester carboxylesterase
VVTQRTILVRTSDGVRLSGLAVPAVSPSAPVTFVVAHGFTNSTSRPQFARLVAGLRRFGAVRAVDFRGHGRSGGGSAVGGDPELLDVDAVVASARADGARAVVTLGLSMGGGAVLRQLKDPAAPHRSQARGGPLRQGQEHVRDTRPMQRVHWLLETGLGRTWGARALGLRLDVPWPSVPPAPVQVVSRIAPTPLLLVHGDRDDYFPMEHFRTLAGAAGPGADVWVEPGMGHGEGGTTPALVERIGRWAVGAVGAAPGRGSASIGR